MAGPGRRSAGALSLACLAGLLGACGSAPSTGTVVGGVIPCSALLSSMVHLPKYAAADVVVLKGSARWGIHGAVYPTPAVVVTSRSVAVNESYTFALPPGSYFIEARFPPPANVLPWVDVTVNAGQETHSDIPSCQ